MILRALDLAIRLRATAIASVALLQHHEGETFPARLRLARRIRKQLAEHVASETPTTCRLAFVFAGHDYGYMPLVEAMQARDEGRQLGVPKEA